MTYTCSNVGIVELSGLPLDISCCALRRSFRAAGGSIPLGTEPFLVLGCMFIVTCLYCSCWFDGAEKFLLKITNLLQC